MCPRNSGRGNCNREQESSLLSHINFKVKQLETKTRSDLLMRPTYVPTVHRDPEGGMRTSQIIPKSKHLTTAHGGSSFKTEPFEKTRNSQPDPMLNLSTRNQKGFSFGKSPSRQNQENQTSGSITVGKTQILTSKHSGEERAFDRSESQANTNLNSMILDRTSSVNKVEVLPGPGYYEL